MKKSKFSRLIIKFLRAVLYVISAGHLCSCECKKETHSENGDE